jgi:DHA1 family bicyclomycin/chloramphenicol resistance-like MFS transporter
VLVIARFCQACGACVGPVLGRAVVRDVYGREGAARILSYLSAAIALAPAIGPIIGGFVETWFGWRANFIVLSLYGAAALALPSLLRNQHPPAPPPSAVRQPGPVSFSASAPTSAMSHLRLACGIFAFIPPRRSSW